MPVEDLEYDQGRYAHVLEALTTGTAYYVRVLAHNAAGYSEPRMAASRADAPVYRIDVGKGSTDFMLHVSARGNSGVDGGHRGRRHGVGRRGRDHGPHGARGVRRRPACGAGTRRTASTANMGDVYDPVDTKFGYEVEFGGDRDAALEISNYQARYGQKSDAKFDGINVTLAAAPAADGYAIKPAYREPSAPTRVKLFSVSRTNLGVAWAPPVLSGGHKVEKYLVEWDSNPEFSTISDLGAEAASVPSTTAGQVAVNASAARGLTVLSDHQFQIRGLTPGRSYWVRVSAWNAKGGDARVSAPAAAQPGGPAPGPAGERLGVRLARRVPRPPARRLQPAARRPERLRGKRRTAATSPPRRATTASSGPSRRASPTTRRTRTTGARSRATTSTSSARATAPAASRATSAPASRAPSSSAPRCSPCASTPRARSRSRGAPTSCSTPGLVAADAARRQPRDVPQFVNVSDLGDNYAYGGDVKTKGSFVRIGGVDGKLYGINQTPGFQEDALSTAAAT